MTSRRPTSLLLVAALAGAGILGAGLWMRHPFAGVHLVSAKVSAPVTRTASKAVKVTAKATVKPRLVPRPAPKPVPALVVLGDSVAAATGCSCTGFGTLLAQAAATHAGADVAYTNAATDGLTTAGLLSQLDDRTLDARLAKATLVTVTIGANDFDSSLASYTSCTEDDGLSCYRSQLRALSGTLGQTLSRLRQLTGPSARILVTGYWNVFLDGQVGHARGSSYVFTSDALTRQVNAVIAAAVPAGSAEYVDLYTAFKPSGSADDTALLAPDGDHPSARGHQLIAWQLMQMAKLV